MGLPCIPPWPSCRNTGAAWLWGAQLNVAGEGMLANIIDGAATGDPCQAGGGSATVPAGKQEGLSVIALPYSLATEAVHVTSVSPFQVAPR